MTKDLDRVRKLLAVARNNGATESEADTARRLAESIMEAAGITADDIAREEAAGLDPLASVAGRQSRNPAKTGWQRTLATAVARVVGCYVYVNQQRTLTWIGTEDQCATANELYPWVMNQVQRLAEAVKKRRNVTSRRWMNGYRNGVANAIAAQSRRITEDRKAKVADSTALTTQSRLDAAIEAAKPPGLRKLKTRFSAAGAQAGELDGASVRLRHDLGIAPSRRLTSG